jgi:NAD(P)-dependent dehydrogenase (short-subunit alcohol dehydrogenase family)
VCVITGAAGGVGQATAARLAAEGATVVGVDLVQHEVGEISLQADVTEEARVRELYERVYERCGRIDVLFNNAGINASDDGSVLDMSIETWNRVQLANLTSVFLCCKHGIP